MKGILGKHIKEGAKDNLMHSPQTIVGAVVATNSVVNTHFKTHPYFYSMNKEGNNSTEDTVKSGVSLVSRAPGISKQSKTWLNPEFGNSSSYGDNTGKFKDLTAEDSDKTAYVGTASFVGGNNQVPSISGIQKITLVKDPEELKFFSHDINMETETDHEIPREDGLSATNTEIRTGTYLTTQDELDSVTFEDTGALDA